MTSARLDFYSLFFQPSEWIGEQQIREVGTGHILWWVAAAALSQAVGDMLASNQSNAHVLAWVVIGSGLHLSVTIAATMAFCAFATLSFWEFPARLEGRLFFRLALLAYLPFLLATPLALIARYFGAVWMFWIPARLGLWCWSLYLLFTGLREAMGLSVLRSIAVLIVAEGFVFLTLGLSMLLTIYRLILQF